MRNRRNQISTSRECLTVPYFIFDLRPNELKSTRLRLKSAAGYVLKHEYDTSAFSILQGEEILSPVRYINFGKMNLTNFLASRLMALNMIGLENFIVLQYSKLEGLTDEVLGDLVDQYLTMKAEENKKTIAGKYEKGTAVTHIMVAAGLQQFHQDSSTEECSICLDELKGKVCRQTNCVHVFHAACVIEWLEKAPTCPVCRMWALGPAFQFPSWIRNLGILRDFLVNRHSVRRKTYNNDARQLANMSIIHSIMAELLLYKIAAEVQKPPGSKIRSFIRGEVGSFLCYCSLKEGNTHSNQMHRFQLCIENTMKLVGVNGALLEEFKENMRSQQSMKEIESLSLFVKGISIKM